VDARGEHCLGTGGNSGADSPSSDGGLHAAVVLLCRCGSAGGGFTCPPSLPLSLSLFRAIGALLLIAPRGSGAFISLPLSATSPEQQPSQAACRTSTIFSPMRAAKW